MLLEWMISQCRVKETLSGAKNRAKAAKISEPEADFWVGLEGGIYEEGDEMWMVEWTVVMSKKQMGTRTRIIV